MNSKSAVVSLKPNPPSVSSWLKTTNMFILKKRQKIIIATIVITIGLLSMHTAKLFFLRTRFVVGLGLVTYVISLWALWEGMTKLKSVVLLILPSLYVMAVASFYFLLPVRLMTLILVSTIFSFSFYILLLSQNVFNVAAARTIPLYRAASTVSFLFTLITAFFLFNIIYSLHLPFYWNGLVVALISLPLILQLLWSVEMNKVNGVLLIYSFILSLVVGEGAIALSFWPVAPTIWSLVLSSMLYVLLGVVTHYMRERLSSQVVFEYLGVGGIVVLFAFLVTSWGG